MRRELFPQLRSAYDQWLANGDPQAIRETADRGKHHWESVAAEMLALHGEHGNEAAVPIRALMETRAL